MGSLLGTQSTASRGREKQLGDVIGSEEKIAGREDRRGKKDINRGEKYLGESGDFFRTLLSGDRQAMMQLLGPEITQINQATQQAEKNLTEFSPRAGGTNSAIANLEASQAGKVGDTFLKARTGAASEVASLGKTFADIGLSREQLGQMSLGQILAAIRQGDTTELERRKRSQDVFDSIVSGAGQLIGSFI